MRSTPVYKFFALFILTAAIALIFAASPAGAGEPTKQLKSGIGAVIAILRDASLKGDAKKSERRTKLRDAIGRQFDFKEMARRSLARNWKKRNKDERKEFVSLFSGILGKSYIGKIEGYTDEEIRYVKENIDDEFARVKTLIVTKRKQEIPITYRMHKVRDKWMVYDVIIEGVSLVNTYRQQFRSFLRKRPFDVLVKKLREKQGEG
jgi:phospholipid transport system substrate-binding protein